LLDIPGKIANGGRSKSIDLREGLTRSMQRNVEIDEPEAAAAPNPLPALRP